MPAVPVVNRRCHKKMPKGENVQQLQLKMLHKEARQEDDSILQAALGILMEATERLPESRAIVRAKTGAGTFVHREEGVK